MQIKKVPNLIQTNMSIFAPPHVRPQELRTSRAISPADEYAQAPETLSPEEKEEEEEQPVGPVVLDSGCHHVSGVQGGFWRLEVRVECSEGTCQGSPLAIAWRRVYGCESLEISAVMGPPLAGISTLAFSR